MRIITAAALIIGLTAGASAGFCGGQYTTAQEFEKKAVASMCGTYVATTSNAMTFEWRDTSMPMLSAGADVASIATTPARSSHVSGHTNHHM